MLGSYIAFIISRNVIPMSHFPPFYMKARLLSSFVPGIGNGKSSTGLVGIKVDHLAVSKMIEKYQILLDRLKNSELPGNNRYRINVEKIARYRIEAAQKNIENPEKVEELCNCGQVEELVIQAENEMNVLEMYIKNRWWEHVKPVEFKVCPAPQNNI